MDKVFTKRLSILADALERAEFPKDYQWYFGLVYTTSRCRTRGCALGFCPTLFPQHWGLDFKGTRYPVLLETDEASGEGAQTFFGLTPDECGALFFGNAMPDFGIARLSDDATPQQVAANIRAFLETKAAEEVDREGLD